MKIIPCDERHLEAIRAIFNEAIVNTTALYDYEPRSVERMQSWFETKRQGNFPILGAEDADGTLMGFATYGTFRPFPGYKFTVEHSVYVDTRFRGRGVGRFLLTRLIETARQQEYHNMVGVIDAENQASIALHRQLGFAECARIRHAGYKFGRWLDVVFYQLLLSTPPHPISG